eukprot:6457265-Amphidinium_carterae.1
MHGKIRPWQWIRSSSFCSSLSAGYRASSKRLEHSCACWCRNALCLGEDCIAQIIGRGESSRAQSGLDPEDPAWSIYMFCFALPRLTCLALGKHSIQITWSCLQPSLDIAQSAGFRRPHSTAAANEKEHNNNSHLEC